MATMDSKLFAPMDLRSLRLKNRIVLSPMLTYSATQGHISDWHFMHLGKFAAGGVGLVFMESTKLDPRGCTTERDAGLWDDKFVEPLRHVTAFIKTFGSVPGIQLGHSGRKARQSLPWEGRAPMGSGRRPDGAETWELIAPSAVPYADGYPVPRAMSLADIHEVIEAWGQAADRARRAGFDVLEIHGAHGYLIHQFLSAAANRRTDEYGGELKNRMRFALEVVERVRQSWPDDKPLFFRLSAIDNEGWEMEHSIILSRLLGAKGVDVIDCTTGGMASQPINSSPKPLTYGYQVEHAERIRREAGIKTMAVGLIVHADHAETILREGQADMVALGRELLQNPNWVMDAAEKLGFKPSQSGVPPAYGYWLDGRREAMAAFNGVPSTWRAGACAGEVPKEAVEAHESGAAGKSFGR